MPGTVMLRGLYAPGIPEYLNFVDSIALFATGSSRNNILDPQAHKSQSGYSDFGGFVFLRRMKAGVLFCWWKPEVSVENKQAQQSLKVFQYILVDRGSSHLYNIERLCRSSNPLRASPFWPNNGHNARHPSR